MWVGGGKDDLLAHVFEKGLLPWLRGTESACNAEDTGSIPGLGRSPGEGNGYPLQYSYLENSMDREAWQAAVHGGSQRVRHNSMTNTYLLTYPYLRLPPWAPEFFAAIRQISVQWSVATRYSLG